MVPLDRADQAWADQAWAVLVWVDLVWADLVWADLVWADQDLADLDMADLDMADLDMAYLDISYLDMADQDMAGITVVISIHTLMVIQVTLVDTLKADTVIHMVDTLAVAVITMVMVAVFLPMIMNTQHMNMKSNILMTRSPIHTLVQYHVQHLHLLRRRAARP
jgi:uncharacterized protein YjbI with pentapeptide repeats